MFPLVELTLMSVLATAYPGIPSSWEPAFEQGLELHREVVGSLQRPVRRRLGPFPLRLDTAAARPLEAVKTIPEVTPCVALRVEDGTPDRPVVEVCMHSTMFSIHLVRLFDSRAGDRWHGIGDGPRHMRTLARHAVDAIRSPDCHRAQVESSPRALYCVRDWVHRARFREERDRIEAAREELCALLQAAPALTWRASRVVVVSAEKLFALPTVLTWRFDRTGRDINHLAVERVEPAEEQAGIELEDLLEHLRTFTGVVGGPVRSVTVSAAYQNAAKTLPYRVNVDLTVFPDVVALTAITSGYGPFPLPPRWRDARPEVGALGLGLSAVGVALRESKHPVLPRYRALSPATSTAGGELSFPGDGWAEGYGLHALTVQLETDHGPATRYHRLEIDAKGMLVLGPGEVVVTPWAAVP